MAIVCEHSRSWNPYFPSSKSNRKATLAVSGSLGKQKCLEEGKGSWTAHFCDYSQFQNIIRGLSLLRGNHLGHELSWFLGCEQKAVIGFLLIIPPNLATHRCGAFSQPSQGIVFSCRPVFCSAAVLLRGSAAKGWVMGSSFGCGGIWWGGACMAP